MSHHEYVRLGLPCGRGRSSLLEIMHSVHQLPYAAAKTFTLVTDEAAFLALEPEWDELVSRSPADSLFLSWAYVSSWWSIYGEGCQLRVLTARDGDGRLCGLAPLVLGPGQGHRRHLRFLTFLGALGDTLSEYLDFVVLPGLEHEVLPEFWRIMSTELAGWDVVSLPLVPASSTTIDVLKQQAGGDAGRLRQPSAHVSPFIRLDNDWDAYLRLRSRSFRRGFQSTWNRAHRHAVRVLHAGVDIPIGSALDRLIALNRARWGDAGLAFHTDEFCAFHRLLAPKLLAKGQVSVMLLQLDGKDAAIRYDFVYGRRLWVFQGGWDPDLGALAPGKILTAYSIQWCIENGLDEYDFLAGDASYKRAWSTDTRHLVDLELSHPRSLRAKAYTSLRATRRFLRTSR